MPRKNIYIRDQDVELFRRAEALAGREERFSAFLTRALTHYLAHLQPSQEGFSMIEIVIREDDNVVKKIFRGRWLIHPAKPFLRQNATAEDEDVFWAVAEGERRGWAVLAARTKTELTDGAAKLKLLPKGANDPGTVDLPGGVVAAARQKAGDIQEEFLEI